MFNFQRPIAITKQADSHVCIPQEMKSHYSNPVVYNIDVIIGMEVKKYAVTNVILRVIQPYRLIYLNFITFTNWHYHSLFTLLCPSGKHGFLL